LEDYALSEDDTQNNTNNSDINSNSDIDRGYIMSSDDETDFDAFKYLGRHPRPGTVKLEKDKRCVTDDGVILVYTSKVSLPNDQGVIPETGYLTFVDKVQGYIPIADIDDFIDQKYVVMISSDEEKICIL